MNILNQYSYIFFALAALGLSFVVLRRILRARWSVIFVVQTALAVLAIGLFLLVRPDSGNISSVDEAVQKVGNGKPTLVAFFSQFCTVCITLEPLVDEIEQDRADAFNILRIDIHTESGRKLRKEFGFSFTPEFVLFDPTGNEVWRDHFLPSDERLEESKAIIPTNTDAAG